jgi:diguanylate cyclase (GGDEF)-like protein
MDARNRATYSPTSGRDLISSSNAEPKPRILLVDDDRSLLNSLTRRLRARYQIEAATSARRALTMLESQPPFAVIVADMTMPGMDGATLLGEVKRFFPGTVRVMLTGHPERDIVSRAVNDCEVFRFLTKPCPPEDLDRALEEATEAHMRWLEARSTEAFPNETALRASRAFLTSRRYDVTTGLANRRAFESEVLAVISTEQSSSAAPVLVHIDIDDFRAINESCGFAAGDEFLRHVAATLLRTVGPDLRTARLSADEFAILLRDRAAGDGLAVTQRLFGALAANPFRWNGEVLPVSACAGVVELTPEIHGVTAWLMTAEMACVAAKQLGKGRLHVALPNDPDLARRQGERQWLRRIQSAVNSNRFTLMFQRIVPLQMRDDGRSHFELLLRMVDDSGALISPGLFVPVAERYHLATAIDRWVVRSAFQWLGADADRQRRISLCSINLSGNSLCDPDFVSFLLATLRACHTPPELVCLEITETAAMADLGAVAEVMGDLRALGFRFSLDDFGSGLCSFSYLKNLPVDHVKIDGSFVRNMDTDQTSCAMVRAINQVAQATGKQTIAEFVENDAIRQALSEIGVDFAQGYAIHRPTPIETF